MSFRSTHYGSPGFRRWGAKAESPALTVIEGERGPPEPEPEPEPVDIEALLAEAREQGRAEGRAEAEAEAAEAVADAQALVAELGPAVEALETLRHEALAQAADDVAELVLLFARRVVDRSLALHPDALPSLVSDAVAQLPNRDQLSIAVAPHLAERLSRSLPHELREKVVADTELENGCVVRTRHVSIEATLAHASEGLERAVRAWLSEQWWAVGDGEFG